MFVKLSADELGLILGILYPNNKESSTRCVWSYGLIKKYIYYYTYLQWMKKFQMHGKILLFTLFKSGFSIMVIRSVNPPKSHIIYKTDYQDQMIKFIVKSHKCA